MRMVRLTVAASALALLAACGSGGGIFGRGGPDEFVVARNAPLVVPPDFALTPPRPGQPQPVGADSRTQALEALFGGPAPRSTSEQQVIGAANNGRADPGIRSAAGDPDTTVVDKGQTTRTIIAVPQGDGADVRVSTPQ